MAMCRNHHDLLEMAVIESHSLRHIFNDLCWVPGRRLCRLPPSAGPCSPAFFHPHTQFVNARPGGAEANSHVETCNRIADQRPWSPSYR